MQEREGLHPITDVFIFNAPRQYDVYCKHFGLNPYDGARAHGIRFSNGEQHIIIDKDYYLRGGIPEEVLPAILVHEMVEFSTNHREATLAEYAYIAEHFGIAALHEYHARLCTLVGGRNDIRNEALYDATAMPPSLL